MRRRSSWTAQASSTRRRAALSHSRPPRRRDRAHPPSAQNEGPLPRSNQRGTARAHIELAEGAAIGLGGKTWPRCVRVAPNLA
eukprot:9487325-Pyramimonas_sp.AAC.1